MSQVDTTGTVGIIGFGNLGQSLTRMFLKHKQKVLASVRTPEKMSDCQGVSDDVTFTCDNKDVARCPIVVICVKPFSVQGVCKEICDVLAPETVVICTAAIVPLTKLQEWLQHTRSIRCMPNVACDLDAGVVPYYSQWDGATAHMDAVFGPNITIPVDSDEAVNQATVISGCGPAFFAWFVTQLRSVADSSLTDAQQMKLVTTTMIGTAKMLDAFVQGSVSWPCDRIIERVASKGGVTEAALCHLANHKIDVAMRDTFSHASERIHTALHTMVPNDVGMCGICTLRSYRERIVLRP